MTDTIDSKTGEILEPITTLVSTSPDVSKLIKDADIPLFKIIETMDKFDWRELKPHQTALLIMQKPFTAGGSTMFLTFKQSILFATRCYELGVSPFSSEVWFDPNRSSVNLTLEGKKQVARVKGIDLGPPMFEELSRAWTDIARITPKVEALKKAGFTKDAGIKCRVRVGDPANKEYSEYIAWLSEWYVERSPVWNDKPLHMLQTRACEKAISMALGTGASDFPTE